MPRIEPVSSWRYAESAQRFDSAREAGSPYSRWSYRLGKPLLTLRCDATTARSTLSTNGRTLRTWDDPLAALHFLGSLETTPSETGPPFKGGWVGFLSYDLGRYFEVLPEQALDDLKLPLFSFTYHASVDAQDASGQIFAIDALDGELPKFDGIAEITEARVMGNEGASDETLQCDFTPGGYRTAVARVIDYIRAGDVFQVNLSQRFSIGIHPRSRTIYENLLARFPAWYGAFLDMGDFALISNSPELFLRVTPGVDGREILTRPIKGTRPRAPGMLEQLRDSEKDRAELNMIVDLERNDLGRLCRVGTVRVTEPRMIEAHPTVYHGAASIHGILREDVGLVDLLRATFPGGSVTGAPKIRAMQIIDELEPVRRGPYCGAIGYISCDGHTQFSVAIRTMTLDPNGRIHIPVGGGIVADSDPDEEYRETLVKARAMFAALGIEPPISDV